MEVETLSQLVLGTVILVLGADYLVEGASALARGFGLSALVVGLTVVAFGTSAPELAVAIKAELAGQDQVAVGNIVGSNLFNVLVILGLSALVAPLVVAQKLVRSDVPVMIGASLLLWGMALDGSIGRIDGLVLFAGAILYTVLVIRASRREAKAVAAAYEEAFGEKHKEAPSTLASVGRVVLGIYMLVEGSRLFVDAAVVTARLLGISELVVGLTIVATGTSLPELATSLVAVYKGERDIAVGNVVGSNLSNILIVMGFSSALADGVPVDAQALGFDIPVMCFVAIACLPVFLSGHVIRRWQGVVFLLYFGAWLGYRLVEIKAPGALDLYSQALMFAVPLSFLTLLVAMVRYRRKPAEAAS